MSIILFVLTLIMEMDMTNAWFAFMIFQLCTRIGLVILPFIWIIAFALIVLTIYIICYLTYAIYISIKHLCYLILLKCVKHIRGKNALRIKIKCLKCLIVNNNSDTSLDKDALHTKFTKIGDYATDYLKGFMMGTFFYNILYHYLYDMTFVETITRTGIILCFVILCTGLIVSGMYIVNHYKYIRKGRGQ